MKKVLKYCLDLVLVLVVVASLNCSYVFAASFEDLQDAIDGNAGGAKITDSGHDNHYGYGDKNVGTGIYGVESWTEIKEDGSSERNVKLNEQVIVSEKEGSKLSVVVGKEDGSVTIDLNGNDIIGNDRTTIIMVNKDASLILKDTSSDNIEEQGTISHGVGSNNGAGGIVVNGGLLIMEGGNISENNVYATKSYASGVTVKNDGTFIMNDGTISDNRGSGVEVSGKPGKDTGGTFIMNGGIISNNDTVTGLKGGNTAQQGGGVYVSHGGFFTMNGGTISRNIGVNGGGIAVIGNGAGAAAIMKGG